jgi:hypothetical protein
MDKPAAQRRLSARGMQAFGRVTAPPAPSPEKAQRRGSGDIWAPFGDFQQQEQPSERPCLFKQPPDTGAERRPSAGASSPHRTLLQGPGSFRDLLRGDHLASSDQPSSPSLKRTLSAKGMKMMSQATKATGNGGAQLGQRRPSRTGTTISAPAVAPAPAPPPKPPPPPPPKPARRTLPDDVQKDLENRIAHFIQMGDLEQVQDLVEKDPRFLQVVDDMGHGLLLMAARSGMSAIMRWAILGLGLDPALPGVDGANALHWSAISGDTDDVRFLVFECGMDREAVDIMGNTIGERRQTLLMICVRC